MNIAVIPARGGSKRLPRKNIKDFLGRPMISRAIKVAQNSALFDHIIVSTDDHEIAKISREYGATTPFLRPSDLSDDHTPTVPVIAHAVNNCIDNGLNAKYVCCIYPCVPLLRSSDLIKSFNLLEAKDADFVYPVTEYAHPIQRAMYKLPSDQMQFINPEDELTRTQDLIATYHDAGQFYWGKSSSWIENMKMHTDGLGMVIPSWRVVDIDTIEDWVRAEKIYKSQDI
jgi:pseudaminic acid cytidylyltransferase